MRRSPLPFSQSHAPPGLASGPGLHGQRRWPSRSGRPRSPIQNKSVNKGDPHAHHFFESCRERAVLEETDSQAVFSCRLISKILLARVSFARSDQGCGLQSFRLGIGRPILSEIKYIALGRPRCPPWQPKAPQNGPRATQRDVKGTNPSPGTKKQAERHSPKTTYHNTL